MKAIQILEVIEKQEGSHLWLDDGSGYPKSYIKEAIKELEELENRSCSNCKYNKEQDNFMIFCDCVMCEDGSKMMWHSFTKHFCCNKWENKDKITNI